MTIERPAEIPAGSGLTYAEFLARTPGLVREPSHAERGGASWALSGMRSPSQRPTR